jgi:hypothetical protein
MVVADLNHVELLSHATVLPELVLLDRWNHISAQVDGDQVKQLLRCLDVALCALNSVS